MRNKLWNKNFTLFFVASAHESLGSSIAGVALSFLVFKLTHSSSAMSITLALKFMPSVITPVVATFIDRIHLKPPLIIGNFLRSTILIIVFLGVKIGLFNVYSIYVMALLIGLIDTAYSPAIQRLLPQVIPKEQLARGVSLIMMASQSMGLIGFVSAGVAIAIFGPEFSLFIEGVCYFIVGFLLLFVYIPAHVCDDSKKTFYVDFILGLKMIKASHIILMIMSVGLLINMLMPSLQVLLQTHMITIGMGAFGYGLFMGLLVGGLLLGNAIITILGRKFDSLYSIVLGFVGISISYAGLGIQKSFHFSLCWAVLMGLSCAMINTGTMVILQTIVPTRFRARVLGTMGAVCQIGIPFSLFILSSVIKKMTLETLFVYSMTATFTMAATWMIAIKKYGHNLLLKPISIICTQKFKKSDLQSDFKH